MEYSENRSQLIGVAVTFILLVASFFFDLASTVWNIGFPFSNADFQNISFAVVTEMMLIVWFAHLVRSGEKRSLLLSFILILGYLTTIIYLFPEWFLSGIQFFNEVL